VDTTGDIHPAGLHADDGEGVQPVKRFHKLMGEPHVGAVEVLGGKQGLCHEMQPVGCALLIRRPESAWPD